MGGAFHGACAVMATIVRRGKAATGRSREPQSDPTERSHEATATRRSDKSKRPACAGRSVDVVHKPSFVPPRDRPRCGGGHSSRAAVTGRLEQPTRGLERVTLHDDASCEAPPNVRLCGLAPDGVCLAASVTGDAVGSYPAVSPWPAAANRFRSDEAGGLFSVALSFAFPRPGVTRQRALWSSDFPPAALRPAACAEGLVHDRRSPGRHRRRQRDTASLAPQRDGCVSWGR